MFIYFKKKIHKRLVRTTLVYRQCLINKGRKAPKHKYYLLLKKGTVQGNFFFTYQKLLSTGNIYIYTRWGVFHPNTKTWVEKKKEAHRGFFF